MRQQIAAANWKMNLTFEESRALVSALVTSGITLGNHQKVILAVPFPYLIDVRDSLQNNSHFFVSAQNLAATNNGAYTGETSAAMLSNLKVEYVIIGHSERREYYNETHSILTEKVNRALEHQLTPIFCCGEPLNIRDAASQNDYVSNQLIDSLFHLDASQIKNIIIAYEPIWAIGTGKTATSDQAQEMHAHIRSVIASKYGNDIAQEISILYGGSVKASNAHELFSKLDIDGGLVGGASLNASEFNSIINSLKK